MILLIRQLVIPFILIITSVGRGEEKGQTPAPEAPESAAPSPLTPPRLIHYVDAEIPEGVEVTEPVVIDAKLSVNVRGEVTAVEIIGAVDEVFGDAARAAMSGFRFEPARKAGEPVACQVVYRYRFDPVLVPVDEPEADVETPDDAAPPVPAEEPDIIESDEYETVIRDERAPPGMTKRVLTSAEIQKIPGTHGDAVLAVQSLPGVAKPPALLGALIVRGSAAHDTISLVNGLYTPSVFHFSAVNSIINSDLVETVSFYPGNFSVRYGRGIGGVIDIETRAPKQDRFHAYLDADLWDATAFAEGPVSKNWSVAVSFRRSYIDGVLRATGLLENQLSFTIAPRYYDFQLLGNFHPKGKDSLDLVIFGSDDKVQFGAGILDESINVGAYLNTHSYIYQIGAHWVHRFGNGVENRLSIGTSVFSTTSEISNLERIQRGLPVYIRDELAINIDETMRVIFGMDTGVGGHRIVDRDMMRQNIVISNDWTVEGHPGLFAELELLALKSVQLMYGFRFDYDTIVKQWTVDPRVSAKYLPTPWLVLNAGFGLFHQTPSMFTQVIEEGKTKLRPAKAIHYSFGVELTPPTYRHIVFSIEGFYKDMRETLALSPTQGEFFNASTGRSLGMEMMLTHYSWKGFFAWVSYTLMKSERDTKDGEKKPFEYDQTHVLTVVGGLSLPWKIDVGLRFRLASGFPYTPLVGIQFIDTWNAGYVGILGDDNSARMPTFHQLDFRIDKEWEWRYLKLRVYLDIQNIYNRQNAVLYIYNQSYTQKRPVYDLPILPSIGIKVTY